MAFFSDKNSVSHDLQMSTACALRIGFQIGCWKFKFERFFLKENQNSNRFHKCLNIILKSEVIVFTKIYLFGNFMMSSEHFKCGSLKITMQTSADINSHYNGLHSKRHIFCVLKSIQKLWDQFYRLIHWRTRLLSRYALLSTYFIDCYIQTFGLMHANALLMQYHYFYWNIAIFHYYFLLMIYCNIALLFLEKCIIWFALFFPIIFFKSWFCKNF